MRSSRHALLLTVASSIESGRGEAGKEGGGGGGGVLLLELPSLHCHRAKLHCPKHGIACMLAASIAAAVGVSHTFKRALLWPFVVMHTLHALHFPIKTGYKVPKSLFLLQSN